MKFFKMAKKALMVSFTAVLLAGMIAGCGDEKKEANTGGGQIQDIQKIKERGVLRVGVKNAAKGFGFQDPSSGEYTGMEIDLANKLAKQLGVKTEFTAVTAATRTGLLDSGDIDCVIATFTITPERKKSWDFTTPYYTDHVGVLVQKASNIQTLADLKDKTVGVATGSTSAKALVEAMIKAKLIPADSYDAKNFDPSTWKTGVQFKQYNDHPAISAALSAGEVAAHCVDKSILAIYHTPDRTFIKEEFAPQDYGIVTRKGSDLSKVTEDFVQACLKDGTIKELEKKYGI